MSYKLFILGRGKKRAVDPGKKTTAYIIIIYIYILKKYIYAFFKIKFIYI